MLALFAFHVEAKAQDRTHTRCFKRCGGYKHVYRLQGLYYPDSSEIRSEISATTGVEFKFYYGNDLPLALVNVTVNDLSTGRIVQKTYSDFDGLASLSLDPGLYEMKCLSHSMISLKDTFSVLEHQGLFLSIRMARDKPLDIYLLRSRKKMSSKELEELKKCLWSNLYTIVPCAATDRYVISSEI